jgi:hypothetical protein
MVIVAGTVVLAVTFVVSIIVTFTDCDPFSHYYIVVPDPGMYLRLITLSIATIFKAAYPTQEGKVFAAARMADYNFLRSLYSCT